MAEHNPPAARPASLTGAQKRVLRGLGHSLSPIVRLGKAGVAPGVVDATRAALQDHELIKIGVSSDCPVDRKVAPHELGRQTGSHVAQIIGRTALLYRERKTDPQIKLPTPKDNGGGKPPAEGDKR